MGFFDEIFGSESKSEAEPKIEIDPAQHAHNDGQKDGSDAGFVEMFLHHAGGKLFHSEKYNEGWDNGVDNQPKDKPFWS